MMKFTFKLKKTDEEDNEKHAYSYSLCLTASNATKLFEKGWQINFIKVWRYHLSETVV